MGESLYRLLGVDRDADREAISRAYRERVKDHHPDVSDDPDAADEFKRLTTAREVLLDDQARTKYDRLGHDTYVATELECDLWGSASERPTDSSDEAAATDDTNTDRARTDDRSSTGGGTTTGHLRDSTASPSTSRNAGRHPTSGRHGYRAHGGTTESARPFKRALESIGSLGAWLVVHAVFLATAAGAAGLLSASTGAIPALSLSLGTGFFGLALFLSALHVVSVLYV